jgi:hypothetical protein
MIRKSPGRALIVILCFNAKEMSVGAKLFVPNAVKLIGFQI